MDMDTTKECAWLHAILEFCPLISYPFDLEQLPLNGIYFFYEKGEANVHNGNLGIVRVGTRKGNNFRSRISEHYLLNGMEDFDKNSPAPKGRSIFRKNLGRALLNKMKPAYLPIWEKDFTTKKEREKYKNKRDITLELRVENQITKILRDNFSFRFIAIADEKQRMGKQGLESRLIGTLSHYMLCRTCSRKTVPLVIRVQA